MIRNQIIETLRDLLRRQEALDIDVSKITEDTRIDEVGFVDFMVGSGGGPGGWSNISTIEVYAKPGPRR